MIGKPIFTSTLDTTIIFLLVNCPILIGIPEKDVVYPFMKKIYQNSG